MEMPEWDPTKPTESLNKIYACAIQQAQQNIDWYEKNRTPQRIWSQGIRVVAVFLVGLGALCPLIDSTGVLKDQGIVLGRWGYVVIAVAVALVQFDRFFGFSTGWIRYMLTQLSLIRSLKEFEYDWILLKAQSAAPLMMLQRVKDFSLQLENLVKQETDAWVAEFQSNIAELEKSLKMEAEARKPGSIRVTVTNARDYDLVQILLNDQESDSLAGVTDGLLRSIPPGRYEVTAIGKKESKEARVTKIVEVQANTMATVELTVPPIVP